MLAINLKPFFHSSNFTFKILKKRKVKKIVHMKKQILFYLILATYSQNIYCQQEKQSKQKFFITTGYGLAGSFFVRSYEEFSPAAKLNYLKRKTF